MRKTTTYVLAGLCLLLLGMVIPSRVRTQEYSSPVRDVDHPARHPYSFSCNNSIDANVSGTSCTFKVPDGQRLVIENVNGFVGLPTGQKPFISVQPVTPAGVASGSSTAQVFLVPSAFQGTLGSFDEYAVNQPTRVYADHQAVLAFDGVIQVSRTAATGGGSFAVNIVGYLITPTP